MATEKQIAANARNAAKSTGPRTEEGKERSRRNGLRHGFAAEVLVPEGDRAKYEAELARWEREAGPSNVVEEHLIRRAAVGSVNLDRIEEARQESRESTACEAVECWERRKRASARRKAQELSRDPSNTVQDLEATAFGCDWLIRRWEALDAPLRIGKAWGHQTVAEAQRLLGLPEGTPGVDAEPEVRDLWRLAAASSPRAVPVPPRLESDPEAPDDPAHARRELRRFIADRVDRLLALRIESWEAVEALERASVIRQALAADTSKEGQVRHRYEASAERASSAAVRLFLNLRDRRRRELLEIAKEARHRDTPRAPVGGGWWREPDSDPAPPGFSRIDPIPSASASTEGEGEGAAPIPIEEAGPDLDPEMPKAVADRPPAAPIAPRRSEPISTLADPAEIAPNSLQEKDLRNNHRDETIEGPRRTEPLPDPDRPADHPDGRPPSAEDQPRDHDRPGMYRAAQSSRAIKLEIEAVRGR